MAMIDGRGDGGNIPKIIKNALVSNGISPDRVVAWELKQQPYNDGDDSIKVDISVKLQPISPEEVKIDIIIPGSDVPEEKQELLDP